MNTIFPPILLLFLLVFAASETRADQHYAIIVGNNVGKAGQEPLKFATADAKRFKDVLVSLGGIKETNVHLLLDADLHQVKINCLLM